MAGGDTNPEMGNENSIFKTSDVLLKNLLKYICMKIIRCINIVIIAVLAFVITSFKRTTDFHFTDPKAILIATQKTFFNSFVDCNMAEAWIGDTFRIFPGKYGEDPLWGNSNELKFADGKNSTEAFNSKATDFIVPVLPANVLPSATGLHGAVWFETVYQSKKDVSGKTIFAVYHNENYPSTNPYNASTGEGYKTLDWPEGIKEPGSAAAVCRIGIMKSIDGGRSWINKGIFIEDLQPRMILKTHNTSKTFAGGTGDPSAIVSGNYLYLFYGEYGYPGTYTKAGYDPEKERSGQCISIARIAVADLDNPVGKARRWDGTGFNAPPDGIGKPVAALQIPVSEGGGPASSPNAKFYWGPSVSWNCYLKVWVMLMAKSEGPSWQGSGLYISYNKNADLGSGKNAQQWSTPVLLVDRPGHILWYPSLQPTDSQEDIANKNTCLQLGEKARLFFKDMYQDKSEYASEFIIQFKQ